MREKWLVVAFLVAGFDQITKYLMIQQLEIIKTLHVIPGFFDFTLRYNRGAAWGILANSPGWQRWFLIALGFVATIVIYIWLGRLSKREKMEGFGLALILGGAIGNLIDRVTFGEVTDFILLYYKDWEWPAFNLADSAICIGVAFLIPSFFKKTA